MTVWEQERRDAPTPLLAGRDAFTRQHRIRDRHGLILERLESPRRRPCRPRLGYFRRQAEVSQDFARAPIEQLETGELFAFQWLA